MNGNEFTSLVNMQEQVCETHGSRPAIGTKRNGRYEWTSFADLGKRVDAFRAALHQMGVKRGDKVAIIANNREEWAVAAYATYGLGAHFVPMYEAQLPKDWQYILDDSEAVVLIVANEEIYSQTVGFVDAINSLQTVVCIESTADDYSYASWISRGESSPVESIEPASDEIAGLIYTSGTTGKPKGVILSHDNFVSNINAVNATFPRETDDVSCSFLPWAHSFGQTAELHCMLSAGCSIGVAESVATLMDDFLLVKPTVLFAVPRIFNKIYDGLQKRMAGESGAKQFLFLRAIQVARRKRELAADGLHSVWIDAQHQVLDGLIFSKVREKFGGRLKYAFSGGAALQREVGEFIDDIGIVVFEGYGLTETSPIATANNPKARRFGTVGVPIPGVTIAICTEDGTPLPDGEDGEIVIIGPNVMQGYHNQPNATAEVIFKLNGKRAFRSGDMGRIEPDGFVKITGRFKEQYKLENGKYVVPTPLEEALRLSGYITHVFLYGDNRLFNICLVVPDFDACRAWCQSNGVSASTPEEIASSAEVHALIGEELKENAADFKGYERPKKWALLSEEFTTENDLLTPKMSVKRHNVTARYEAAIGALYE
jgi:long-chain acyl-CoA synthetase